MDKLYGIVAEYKNPGELLHAAESIKEAGFKQFDTYSPFPIHGMDDAMGIGQSKLAWLSLGGGLTGLLVGISLQVWVSAVAYKLIISGKPLASYPAFIPVTFELTILFTAFATVFGMIAMNKLPQFYHPVFNHSRFKKATCDGFFVSIEASDKKYDETKINALLEKTGATHIEVIKDEA
ncbi:DUF3341 domain-containing protein [Candidatus Marinamargulisbacteria bacterium SCGC AG-439-L15]|nr:DUF3341 domain-containing protein [Candidatus Marinamargulisbacteria bacterium SCGC AG-439-L15]